MSANLVLGFCVSSSCKVQFIFYYFRSLTQKGFCSQTFTVCRTMLLNLFLEVRVGREDRFDLIVSRLGAFVSVGFFFFFFLQEVV